MTSTVSPHAAEQRRAPALPGGAFVEGRWVPAGDEAVLDPEDGAVVGYAARTSPADVARAIGHLSNARAEWPVRERQAALRRAAAGVAERRDEFAALIAAEGIKTVTEARGEVDRCIETLTLSATVADALIGETIPFDSSPRGAGKIGWYTREPLGVVGAITPFNDPLNLVAHKVGPALLAGNGVILKPSEHTPLTALTLTEVLLSAGVPADRIAVVCGDYEVGNALVSDSRLAAVSFTGGPHTAEAITRSAGIKKLLMELGGNNPTIVCEDADVDRAVSAVVDGAFGAAGQNCLSVQRVYVHSRVHDTFLRRVVAGTGALKVGAKTAPDTDIGPMISEAAARRVEGQVEYAVRQGATVWTGAVRRGSFYEPTVLTDVPTGSTLLTKEIFGPVVVVEPFESYADAVTNANSTGDALHAGVFTESVHTAKRLSGELRAGCVLVNETSDFRIDAMPFGGFGTSGIGREGVRFAVRELSAPRSVILAG
ncbi:aldehyde dehydrogenase family protein [Solicola gregarius]|uniref:Aldehyde dehydrogenase family protein n=1 Tax=Solicola gregarius TaxID=2908642 RepID=A0AA46TFX4_9ACTN|nr:aldehyde dehydrogenase family protein [Solicola gregarius]UYM04129.1 aldehyde dehydrogenase family protein [Solicola gregarius]